MTKEQIINILYSLGEDDDFDGYFTSGDCDVIADNILKLQPTEKEIDFEIKEIETIRSKHGDIRSFWFNVGVQWTKNFLR